MGTSYCNMIRTRSQSCQYQKIQSEKAGDEEAPSVFMVSLVCFVGEMVHRQSLEIELSLET